MKKSIAFICIMICSAALFAGTVSMNLGFSILGANAGAAIKVSDSTKIGAAVSLAREASTSNDAFGWIYAQGFVAIDPIESIANDLDMRFGLSYLKINGSEGTSSDDESEQAQTGTRFIGLTFGIQYTHWFGSRRNHGIFVGMDLPIGGYTETRNGDGLDESGPFIGPFTSLATLAVGLVSFKVGYGFQF